MKTRRAGRNPLLAVLTGLAVLATTGVLAAWGYWRYAMAVPPLQLKLPPMPVPNGYDHALKALQEMKRVRRPKKPAKWPDGTPRELGDQVKSVRPYLNRLRASLAFEWRIPVPSMSLFDTTPAAPILSEATECARLFVAESRLASFHGDDALAMHRCLDALTLAGRMTMGSAAIGRVVAVETHATAFADAERLAFHLPEGVIPAAILRVRQVRESWPPLTEMWESERQLVLTAVHKELTRLDAISLRDQYSHFEYHAQTNRVIRWKQSGAQGAIDETHDATLVWETIRLMSAPRRAWISYTDTRFRRLVADSRRRPRHRRVAATWDDLGSLILSGRSPVDLGIALREVEMPSTHLALLEVYLAVRMHRLTRGAYPKQLADIDRRWLPAIPCEPWGQPVAYRLIVDEPRIYSLGADGRDDGGSAANPKVGGARRGDLLFGRLHADSLPQEGGSP